MAAGGKLGDWMRGHVPTRKNLETNRLLRPFAHLVLRSELWRFNRRSVPRGVALGLFTGIAIPFAHTPLAVFGAAACRANVPIAATTTWVSNPLTWVILFPTAITISNRMGFHVNAQAFYALLHSHAGIWVWLAWLGSRAAPAVMVGLFVLATPIAAVGYLLTSLFWRLWIANKRRQRLRGGALRAAG